MAGSIFISYRREDGKAEARSIYQWLSRAFGRRQLFMDVDTIEKGRDFRQVLDHTLAKCDVMLAIVEPRWLDARDPSGGLRLQGTGDFVQLEIAIALKRNIPVIPVLVDGARLPRADELPGELQGLASRQAAIVTHENPAAASRLLFTALEVGEPMAVVHTFTYGLTHFNPVMPAFIRELQMRLKEAGLYNGAADGKLDEPTLRGLEALKGRRS